MDTGSQTAGADPARHRDTPPPTAARRRPIAGLGWALRRSTPGGTGTPVPGGAGLVPNCPAAPRPTAAAPRHPTPVPPISATRGFVRIRAVCMQPIVRAALAGLRILARAAGQSAADRAATPAGGGRRPALAPPGTPGQDRAPASPVPAGLRRTGRVVSADRAAGSLRRVPGRFARYLAAALTLALAAAPGALAEARIKDLVEFDGVRGNDLVGYGLVVGLDGTGDGLRNAPFTEEAMVSLLERLGVNVSGEDFRPRNVAAVLVTAVLPAFARTGSKIDVSVSTIGDASSLVGGTLIMTPLNAADGNIYAVAQGGVISGGQRVEGDAASVTEGVPTSGTIPSGARVEREIPFVLNDLREFRLALRDPDFTTAARIAAAINGAMPGRIARMIDSGTVTLDLSAGKIPDIAQLIAAIENIEVRPDQRARVVVDQRSGTIVLGSDVRISRVAVTQGNLTLRVREAPLAVQPNPFAPNGAPIILPRTDVELDEEEGTGFALVEESVSLPEVIEGLNALGVTPREMIDILKAIKAAGALHAEFVVQ